MHDNFLMVSNRKTKLYYIQLEVSGHLDFFFFFWRERERERGSFNLWHPLMMIAFYHQTKTPISFWCRRELNSKSLIQLSLGLEWKLYFNFWYTYVSFVIYIYIYIYSPCRHSGNERGSFGGGKDGVAEEVLVVVTTMIEVTMVWWHNNGCGGMLTIIVILRILMVMAVGAQKNGGSESIME